MNITNFEVNGTRYISGLFWQVIYNKSLLQKEAIKSAADLNMDLIAYVNDGDVVQIGLASSLEIDVNNAYSFAATLRESIDQKNWAGVFRISESIWTFVAVKDNGILPGSDICSANVSDLIDRLNECVSTGDFEHIYAPDGMLEHSTPLIVADILPEKPNKLAKVRPLKVEVSGKLIFSIILALSLISGGGYAYKVQQDNIKKEQAMAAARAMAAANALKMKSIPPIWLSEAMPSVMLTACSEAAFKFEVSKSGWLLGDITCDKMNVISLFKRNGGTVTDLINTFKGVNIKPGGELAELATPLNLISKRDVKELVNLNESMISVTSFLQSIGAEFTLVNQTPPRAQQPVNGLAPMAITPSIAINMKIDSLPVDLGATLDGFPGLVIKTVKWNASDLNWAINGVIYGK